MKRFNYFAYGSNMDAARMLARCPGARPVGAATLPGFRLVERLYADVEPSAGCEAKGLLWSVTEADLASLDRHEGVAGGVYERLVVPVKLGGQTVGAYCYLMTEATRRVRNGIAYPRWYAAICRRGAVAHGVGGHFGKKAKEHRTTMTRRFKVAVYGTLMAGERNERWAADALDRRPCLLRGTLYDTGWGYPAFIPDADGSEVRAELLTVTEDTLARMDELEGYPRLYRRETVQTMLGDGSVESALVYVLNTRMRGAKVIAGGDWREYRRKFGGNAE
jgi:gamma-glutamylcyclotransferase (GGCT)/AIG2-like uncharacterized protein YtfP